MSENLDKMKTSMGELSTYLTKAQEQKKQLSQYNTILTVAIISILVLVILIFYFTIKENFSSEKMMSAVSEYSPKILPELSEATVYVVTNVAPKYSELIQVKAVSSMPRLADATNAELGKLSENISTQASERLNKTLKNVIDAQKNNIIKGFNGVDEKKLNDALIQLENDLNQDFMDVCTNIMDKTLNQFVSLKKTVDTFDDKNLPQDKAELSILFLHNLILLADNEMMTNLKASKKGGK